MKELVADERRRRIQRLKKLILLLLISSILLPIVLCIILFIRMQGLQEQMEALQELVLEKNYMQTAALSSEEALQVQQPRTSIRTETVESMYTASEQQRNGAGVLQETGRKVYLTFDDGPSCYTDEILDILKQYGVKATFFVVGKTDEQSLEAYRRIVEEGHTLGMHSYSHKYRDIYQSVDTYAEDLSKLQEFLYDTTGVWSRYVRFPGGSSNRVSLVDMTELIAYLKEQGIQYFDWNISSGDAVSGTVSAEKIVDNVMQNVEKYDTVIILMHDAADKETTVEALPVILEGLLEFPDTGIFAIDDETVPVQHIKATD